MTRGIYDDADPNVEPFDFEQCSAGTYKITGIDEWITDDDDGIPVYVDNEYQGMVVRMRLSREDGGVSPAHSASALDMMLLVKAFGGDVKQLSEDRHTTEFLIKAYDLINKSKKTVTATVNESGWVSFIKECVPPEGYYRWKFAGFFSLGEDKETPYFTPQTFKDNVNEQIILKFEIVGDGFSGKPSPYNGFQSSVRFTNPFDGTQDGVPRMAKTKAGGRTVHVNRMYKLIDAFAPEMLDYNWDEGDPNNPIEVFVKLALEGKRVAVAQFAKHDRGTRYQMQLDSLSPLEQEEPEAETYDPDSEFAKQHPKLAQLAEYILGQCDTAFTTVPVASLDDLALTTDGKAWAGANLVGLMEKAELEPQAKPLRDFTEDECGKILNAIWGGWA